MEVPISFDKTDLTAKMLAYKVGPNIEVFNVPIAHTDDGFRRFRSDRR